VTQDKAGGQDIKKILAAARARETTVAVCLAGDLAAEADRLTAELDRLGEPGAARSSLADVDPRAALVADLDTVIELMRSNEVTFRFRKIPDKEYSDLVAAHPSEDEDEAWNADTFPPALVAASCIDPAMSDEDVAELWDVLPFGSRIQLGNAAYNACRGGAVSIPTSRAVSATPPSSDAR